MANGSASSWTVTAMSERARLLAGVLAWHEPILQADWSGILNQGADLRSCLSMCSCGWESDQHALPEYAWTQWVGHAVEMAEDAELAEDAE